MSSFSLVLFTPHPKRKKRQIGAVIDLFHYPTPARPPACLPASGYWRKPNSVRGGKRYFPTIWPLRVIRASIFLSFCIFFNGFRFASQEN
jgi:hypothetical protein